MCHVLNVFALPLQLVNGRQEMMKVHQLALQASPLVSTHTPSDLQMTA